MFISSSPFGPERLLRITMIHVSLYDALYRERISPRLCEEGRSSILQIVGRPLGPQFLNYCLLHVNGAQ